VTVRLSYASFQLEVLRGATPLLLFNGRSLFNMEHPRTKGVRACRVARGVVALLARA
jgi:hypothetical protein